MVSSVLYPQLRATTGVRRLAIGSAMAALARLLVVLAAAVAAEDSQTISDAAGHHEVLLVSRKQLSRFGTGVASSRGKLELPAAGGEMNAAGGWTLHHVGGIVVFAAFLVMLCWPLPIIKEEYQNYKEYLAGGKDTFQHYLSYRFSDWFTTYEFAPSLILIFLTMALIVCGALMYALVMGESPSHSLWRIFVWASGSPAEGEASPFGRFLGLTVTIAGMIILSLLFGIVSEVFATKMNESRQGLDKVVEGGHVVMLGYTDCSLCMLEELANAKDSEGGGTFVILCRQPKEDVEKELHQKAVDLRSSRLIIRQGDGCYARDLEKVAVHSAAQVVLLASSTLSPEEADAQTLRTILALKGKQWPSKGRVVIQCVEAANKSLLSSLMDAEVVVVGNIVAKLMVQSSQQHGLATVFGMMLGFEGDEFYISEWNELVGCSFRDVAFRFPDAVCMGVFRNTGQCLLNPGWDYIFKEGDQLVVLAEDNDTYEPVDKPFWEPPTACDSLCSVQKGVSQKDMDLQVAPLTTCALLREENASNVLMIGWNPNISQLLANLDDLAGLGTKVTVYSSHPEGERENFLRAAQLMHNDGKGYAALMIKHVEVEPVLYSSRIELSKLKHFEYEKIFILAEGMRDSSEDIRDERTLAVLAQLQLLNTRLPKEQQGMPFDPVVEMCEDSTKEHLKLCGFTNFVHSRSLISQALAAVTEEPMVNAVYAELMSGAEQSFDIRDYADFLPKGQQLPSMLSFAEAMWQISTVGDITLVAWSHPDTWEDPDFDAGSTEIVWEMNPVAKTKQRAWIPEDRVVVVRRFRAPRNFPSRFSAFSTKFENIAT